MAGTDACRIGGGYQEVEAGGERQRPGREEWDRARGSAGGVGSGWRRRSAPHRAAGERERDCLGGQRDRSLTLAARLAVRPHRRWETDDTPDFLACLSFGSPRYPRCDAPETS